jgi:hypothetical protein
MSFAAETDTAGAAIAALNIHFRLIKKFHYDFLSLGSFIGRLLGHLPCTSPLSQQKSATLGMRFGGRCGPDWLGSLSGEGYGQSGLFSSLACRDNISKTAAAGFFREGHLAIGQGEKRMIFAHANIGARVEFRAALTNNNVAGDHILTTKFLDAKTATG